MDKNDMKVVRVVSSVIFEGNMVLAAQRGYGKYEGWWEFPGGKIEENETNEQALRREIKEELDIDINVGKLMTIIEYSYPEFHLKMYCYKCTINSGQIRLIEHKNCRWVGAKDIMDLKWLPADLNFVKELKQLLL